MQHPLITVVIPTLKAGPTLLDCVLSLERQTRRDFELIIVDNSGRGLVNQSVAGRYAAKVIENDRNLGFGPAINQGLAHAEAPYLATLNDDAIAAPNWIDSLVSAIEKRPDAGMCASRISLSDGRLDSAGMLVCGDASSKQRGQNQDPEAYGEPGEVLFASGCAALYRRAMLEQLGGFDEDFFIYCEDTDLGLRAQWAGWKCLYVPDAAVEHRYSLTAGRASVLKAYYVERNRLFVMAKNFPARWLLRAPLVTAERYFWHLLAVLQGRGAAGQFHRETSAVRLPYIVVRAHGSLLFHAVSLWRKRRAIRRSAKIGVRDFQSLLAAHAISAREVAAL